MPQISGNSLTPVPNPVPGIAKSSHSPPVQVSQASQVYEAVYSTQRRLDDEDGGVWSYDEILLYIKDGYDLLCRQTKCLFDMHVIENRPQMGNWSTDLERHLAEQTPGMQLTEGRLHFTAEHERDALIGGLGGSTEGPTPTTAPYITPTGGAVLSSTGAVVSDFDIPTRIATGRLPDETVDVLRVTWDELELPPEESAMMRRMDSQYERREGGDPRYFTMDKEGLLTLRLVPPAQGDAVYHEVNGSWGTMTFKGADPFLTPTPTIVGEWGILREVEGTFPAGGPHGTPTRWHPAAKNTVVEIARLGRPLEVHGFEIPSTFIKFVIFWAMHRALKRDGPGQDLKLAKHYSDRFEMGIDRMRARLRKVNKEKVLRMGFGGETQEPFGMGDPQLPYPYGRSTGRRYD